MPGTGIWLDPDTLQQSAGQIWMQRQTQQLHAQVQAGQDWAAQQIQRLQQQAQAQVQTQTAPPAAMPTPAPPEPVTPAPTPPVPPPTPVSAPPPQAPAPTTEPPPSTPSTPPQAPTPDMLQAGQDWAAQQLQQLQASPAPVAAPQPIPTAQPAQPSLPTPTPPVGAQNAISAPVDASSTSAFARSFAPYAQYAAQQLGVDPTWVTAMAASESNYGKAPGNELFGIKALPGQASQTLATHEANTAARLRTRTSRPMARPWTRCRALST